MTNYRENVIKTAIRIPKEDRLLCATFGLSVESGEIADLIKKNFFHGQPFDRQNFLRKLGDLLWYIEFTCCELGINSFTDKDIVKESYESDVLVKLSLKISNNSGEFSHKITDHFFNKQELDIEKLKYRLLEMFSSVYHYSVLLNTTIEEIQAMNMERLSVRFPECFQ